VADGLTVEQLSRYTGEPEERLLDWEARGLLKPPIDGLFESNEVERIRLVQLLLRRGIALDAIVERWKTGYLEWFDSFPF
jgi:hypothetical protein